MYRIVRARLEHFEFLETEQIDPITTFLTKLRENIGSTVSIFVWNKGFEGTINKRMERRYIPF
jgi:hypothetical protein